MPKNKKIERDQRDIISGTYMMGYFFGTAGGISIFHLFLKDQGFFGFLLWYGFFLIGVIILACLREI